MAGSNIRYIRSAVLEILQQDYLRTARAKGIGRFRVINKHALRNALVPIVTVIGMEIPVLFGGAPEGTGRGHRPAAAPASPPAGHIRIRP